MNDIKQQTATIIGGGLGGLFTGAFLAREGYEVTVLEQNLNIGGGLQTFRRCGEEFDAGMHILGGFQPGGTLDRICRYLGISDRLEITHDEESGIIDTITYLSDGQVVNVPRGREHFTEYFQSLFPENSDEIKNYVDAIYRMADEVNIFNLRPDEDYFKEFSPQFFMPANRFIASYITSAHLQAIMAFVNPMYGGIPDVTPAYIHSILSVLYIDGQSKFRGGSRQLASALQSVIEENGGAVLPGRKVTEIEVDAQARMVKGVRCETGETFTSDVYISSIHPVRMLDIATKGAFKKAFSERMRSIPNAYSAFQAFFIMRPDTFPYLPGANFLIDDYTDTWKLANGDDDKWPRGMMYVTPAEKMDSTFSRKVVVNCVMPFSAVEKWTGSSLGNRPGDYEQWKKECLEHIITKMEKLYPDFSKNIEHSFTASPLTIRDYFDVPAGSLYGYVKDSSDILRSQITVFTKIKNLLLTGQCINLHGICGVPLTAILTVEALVGRNVLINKISTC